MGEVVGTEDDRLRAHLFGSDRLAFPNLLRAGLVDLQSGRCFSCDRPLERRVEIDHFLARSRWPNDAIENLVVADRCNGAKSDHLAAADHLLRWSTRTTEGAADLRDLADATRWPTDADRSIGLVRSTYGHLAAGTPLWLHGREFVEATGPLIVTPGSPSNRA